MYQASLTFSSGNKKTGYMPVSTTTADTCPNACPLKSGGCYAKSGPIKIHWDKVTRKERGKSWEEFCKDVRRIPRGQLWRYAQAGDLPGDGVYIDRAALEKLIDAASDTKPFSYTHYDVGLPHNADAVKMANDKGFTVNLSANSPSHADQLANLGIAPVTTVLPKGTLENVRTPQGRTVVLCPAYTRDTTCVECRLCAVSSRSSIVGFPLHGSGHRKAAQALGLWADQIGQESKL